MRSLALAGRSILWPNACACCLGPADTSVKLEKTVSTSSYNWFTRTTTTRHDTRSWDVPYCRRCLEHIHAVRRLRNYSESAVHLSWLVGGVGGVAWLLISILSRPVVAHDPLYYTIVVGLLALVILLFWWTYPLCTAHYRRRTAEIDARRAFLQDEVDANLCPSCSAKGHLAVRYDGWREKSHYGGEWREEWQLFSFESEEYADVLAGLNETRDIRD